MNLSLDAYDLKHCGKMMMALNEQRESKEHSDFAIMVGDKEIPAHRNVLSAGSDYFRAMLSHENVESRTGIVTMQQVQYSSVKTCIDYIYTGNILTHDEEDCEQLMHTASMMQIKGLCDKIAILLEEELSPESFYSTKMIANTLNCTGLVESCNKYALKNFQSIATEDEFKHLNEDYVSFLLGSKLINATEAVKCKALIIWTNFDLETRASMFGKLLEYLDLSKISEKYQKFLVEKEPLVFDSARHHAILMNTLTGGPRIVAEDIDIKNAPKPINAIAVFNMKSRSIQAFHPKMKTWTKLQNIRVDFMGKRFTAVVLGSIYAFDDSGNNSKAVEKFDPSGGTWSPVTDRPVKGFYSSIVAAGGFIYCIGGLNDGYLSNTMKFNSSDSTWAKLPSMPTARNGAAAVELIGKIYVVGGYNSGYLDIVECFDTDAETWTTVPRLGNPRRFFKVCVVEGKIFAVVGNNYNHAIEEYDPAVNSWKVVETMDGKEIEDFASIALNVPYINSEWVSQMQMLPV
ncbi:kelch-like protein 3 isoform X5 [Styela clava]